MTISYIIIIFTMIWVAIMNIIVYNGSRGGNMGSFDINIVAVIISVLVGVLGVISSIFIGTKSSNSKIRDAKDEILKSQGCSDSSLTGQHLSLSDEHKNLSDEHKELLNKYEIQKIILDTQGKSISKIDEILTVEKGRREALSLNEFAGLQKSADNLSEIISSWEKIAGELTEERVITANLKNENEALRNENRELKDRIESLENECEYEIE